MLAKRPTHTRCARPAGASVAALVAADPLEVLPSGDAVIRQPREGWSPGFYEAELHQYVLVRGSYPRTARMHPSTTVAVAPADRATPPGWPIYDAGRHYAPARIILSDDAPQLPE